MGRGLPVTGEGVTRHLRGSKDKGRDDGWNPAIAKVKDGEPGDALHGNDVGQEEEEEQVVALKQVHILGGLPQGPEVLRDLGLLSKSTGKVSATWLLWRGPTSSGPEKRWPGGPIHKPAIPGSPATVHRISGLHSTRLGLRSPGDRTVWPQPVE